MIDFDTFVVMKQGFLNELNVAADRIIEEKKAMPLNYMLIEQALKAVSRNRNMNTRAFNIVVPIKKEEMLKTTLNFFESIDPEFYEKAVKVILGQNADVRMHIYDSCNAKSLKPRNENEFDEYTPYGIVETRKGHALVNIPTGSELRNKEEKEINNSNPTLDDLYTIVHEIGHLLDLNLDLGKATKKELAGEPEIYEENITRELTAEATTIALEGMLSEYLLKNTSYPHSAIQQITYRRINDCLGKIRIVYAKLLLAKEKEEKGEITLSFIEKAMRDYGLSIQGVRRMAHNIINAPKDLCMQNRYAIGGLLAPTIIKTYKTSGSEPFKRYLEEAKQCNLESALKQIGVQLNEEGFNKVITNFQEYLKVHSLDMEER